MSKEFLQQNPEVARQVFDLVKEASNVKTMIETQQGHLKDIKARAKSEYGIDGKTFGKLFGLYHNQAREQFEEENQDILEQYDLITAPAKQVAP
ncbi:transcriptional regulator [Pantoea phage Phynn]|nr:transcriptional regulator [Pantoea phage Phynn]